MALVGPLIKRSIALSNRFVLNDVSPLKLQHRVLKRLLRKAAITQFGRQYHFIDILRADHMEQAFKDSVPIFDYNAIFNTWWNRTLHGEENICWPGKTKYFALSSGTSESASKRIPLTGDMIRAIKRASIKQILSARNFNLPAHTFEKKIMMLGGSTTLNRRGDYYEGDLSGISAKKIPYWFNVFYKPGKKIARQRNWEYKLNEISRKAKNWDISIVVGVPAWIQIMLERIVEYNDVENIHDVWPNFEVYVHSGVSFEPYREGFKKLLGRPIIDIDSYLASEGFIAFENRPDADGMRMQLSNGIYFEFIPFNDENFNEDGELKSNVKTLSLAEAEEKIPYALLLTTCAGAWRYLIGDVIEFANKERSEIKITGRTKHYLSLTGEHLSVENMNEAIRKINEEMNADIREFAVAGIPSDHLFIHHWWIGCDQPVDSQELKQRLDNHLKELNDDYATERISAIKEVIVDVIPNAYFMEWMRKQGKMGGQHKFPRVLKKQQLEDWMEFLKTVQISN